MKNFRKIFAVLLAMTLLMGIFVLPTNAADEAEGEEIVARMYLGHKERYSNMSGHTWIYIENLTNHSITVGAYTVKKGKGVSCGTYGYQIMDGRGLYYNVEAWRYKNSALDSYIYLSKDLTQEQLEAVSNKILYSGTWSYLLNCAYFALGVWNTVPGNNIAYLGFPFLTQIQMLLKPECSIVGFEMIKAKKSDCFKQIGVGPDATLVEADPVNPKDLKE
ncbi:MAG: hypothetical protein IKK85_04775 [Clostridia bacterium]|nr:hypothetical protein [Clostridia bacterium]